MTSRYFLPAITASVSLLLTMPSNVFAQDEATAATTSVYRQAEGALDWSDRSDFDDALRGLIARYPEQTILGENGNPAWTFRDDEALRNRPAPPTVHPLLWRQQQLNSIHGLFRVTDRIYQLRGFDLANMTIIEGDTGVIVVDPLTSVEVSRAALELYYSERPRKPVVAVIYTHSHMDHFGGVRGIVSPEDVESSRVQVLAPRDFLKEAVSENVSAGNAMLRRTIYYSGIMVPPGPEGPTGAGLGPGVSNGRQSFIAPTEEISEDLAQRTIDGVEFVFLNANGTEAPSEFVFFLPQFGVLDVAEVAVRTQHNVLTPRGAKARDAALWWQAIDRMIVEFGDRTEILIGQHHWPSWSNETAIAHLENQRDLYKAIHDRSMNLANRGSTLDEIGDQMDLPPGLRDVWAVQDYYGTFGSGGQATYQYYLGWYDGNPAHLDRLSGALSAPLYVEYMGGADAILARARDDFDAGRYRWVAEVLDRLIFAEPDNEAAKQLQARTLIQLGYQQPSATWRNVYLTAARELREGVLPIPAGARLDDFLVNMSPDMLLDYAGIALSPARADDTTILLNLDFGGEGTAYQVAVDGGLLTYRAGTSDNADATLQLDKRAFDRLLNGRTTLAEAVASQSVALEGDADKAGEFFTLFDTFAPDFNIVTP